MKTKTLGLLALLTISALTLAGCNKTIEAPTQEISEAGIYCINNGGSYEIVTSETAVYGECTLPDGTVCEEWDYLEGKCPATEEENTLEETPTSEIYSEEDLAAAKATILNTINNEWNVQVESFKVVYAGDEIANDNLEYCKSLNPEITECAVFTSSFHIPEQDIQMAGAFESNADIDEYGWYLGRATAGEWEVLTNGFG